MQVAAAEGSTKKADLRLQGSAFSSDMARALMERDVPVHVNAQPTDLIVEDRRLQGVVASMPGGSKRIRVRRGALIAMGGYDWSAELMERFDGRRGAGSRSPESVTGDHFALVEPLGVELGRVQRSNGFGYPESPAPKSGGGWEAVDARWQPFYHGWPHAIAIDGKGDRFTDESGGHQRSLNDVFRAGKLDTGFIAKQAATLAPPALSAADTAAAVIAALAGNVDFRRAAYEVPEPYASIGAWHN